MPAPQPNEYAPFYGKYVTLIGERDIIAMLETQYAEDLAWLRGLPADRHRFAYAEGKWTLQEVLQHMSDTERIFAYRALRFGRGDTTPLPGFDENTYTPAARVARRSYESVVEELAAVRLASLALVRSFDEEALSQFGTASGNAMSCRGAVYSIAGHWMHHMNIIRERYV